MVLLHNKTQGQKRVSDRVIIMDSGHSQRIFCSSRAGEIWEEQSLPADRAEKILLNNNFYIQWHRQLQFQLWIWSNTTKKTLLLFHNIPSRLKDVKFSSCRARLHHSAFLHKLVNTGEELLPLTWLWAVCLCAFMLP